MAAKALPAGSPGLTPTPTPRCRAPCCVACAGSSMLIIARHPPSNPLLPPPSSISDNTSPSWTRRPFNSSSSSEKKRKFSIFIYNLKKKFNFLCKEIFKVVEQFVMIVIAHEDVNGVSSSFHRATGTDFRSVTRIDSARIP